MRKNKIQLVSSLIFIVVFATGLSQPNLLEAAISSANYDFGQVLVSSTKMLALSMTNLEDTSTTINELVLDRTDCSDFSVVATPESMTIPPNGTIQVVIGFRPSAIGTCSDTLNVYADNSLPYLVTLTGTGIEAESEQPEPIVSTIDDSDVDNAEDSDVSNTEDSDVDIAEDSDVSNIDDDDVGRYWRDRGSFHRFRSRGHGSKDGQGELKTQRYLTQIEEIKSFMQTNFKNGNLKGVGKGRKSDKVLKALNKMLITTSQLIEKGNLKAARKKLIALYKKTNGVKGGKVKEEFASKIQQLTEQLNLN